MEKIISAEFEKGIKGTDSILESSISQIAFIGRSNVGKSSVINSLLGRKNLVKSSSVPGKTREINFFLVNKNVYFVDLPGYGFSKMSKKESEKLRKLIWWYFTSGEARPKFVVLIIDAKVGVTDLDLDMIGVLKEYDHNVIVLANKIDKLKKNDIKKKISEIEEKIYEDAVPYSAKTKLNREKFLSDLIRG
jgi:GTP-binding protein